MVNQVTIDGARQVIDAYFRSILAALQAAPIVESHNVTFEQRSPFAGHVRGDVFSPTTPSFISVSSSTHSPARSASPMSITISRPTAS